MAFDCASASGANAEELYMSLSRGDLLRAVSTVSRRIRADFGTRLFNSRTERCLLHVRTGLEHVVFMLACARLGIVYTSTSMDASDVAILHRLTDFAPTILVVTADGDVRPSTLPGSNAMSRIQSIRRLGLSRSNGHVLRCHRVTYAVAQGDTTTLLLQSRHYGSKCLSKLFWPVGVAVTDSYALCVVYTSGSTGKPKGIVHGHAGYGACVSRSMNYVFEVTRYDKFLALATFAWITGQSYMLFGPLISGCCSILVEGSPLGIDGLRWARIAKDRSATILKMASAFARHIMADPTRENSVLGLCLPQTLRLGTFCAEPVSVDVQVWACEALCARFFNSYWATEHGSIVLTRHKGSGFKPDTKCWPVPWINCTLSASHTMDMDGGLGDIVITQPHPGLGRTIWGDILGYIEESELWVGDIRVFQASYFKAGIETESYGFVQGDAARVDTNDGGWTFHGRSDEVINVSGVRVGVEEIEKAIWCRSCAPL